MGKYINELPNGTPLNARGKANQISSINGVEEISKPSSFNEVPADKGLVCVVENGMFDAAVYAYSEGEFNAFTSPDNRRKRWFLFPKQLVEKIAA